MSVVECIHGGPKSPLRVVSAQGRGARLAGDGTSLRGFELPFWREAFDSWPTGQFKEGMPGFHL